MRLFHYALLPYLPELQFKGQLREIVLIMHQWRDEGKTRAPNNRPKIKEDYVI